MSKNVKEVTDRTFAEAVLESKVPVVVDFGADWCPPCRLMLPVVESLAEKYAGEAKFVAMNVDENALIMQRYGIKGIPTIILFIDGKERERIVGATSKEAISRLIDGYAVSAKV